MRYEHELKLALEQWVDENVTKFEDQDDVYEKIGDILQPILDRSSIPF